MEGEAQRMFAEALAAAATTLQRAQLTDALQEEKRDLIAKVDDLRARALKNAEELAEERKSYKIEIEKLRIDNDQLVKSNGELKAEITRLESIVAEQETKINEQSSRIALQDQALARLLRRENFVTAREAMRALEWFLCVEAVGSAKDVKSKKLYTIAKLSDNGISLPAWATADVVAELRETKRDGDAVLHDMPFELADVQEAFKDADPKKQAVKEKMLAKLVDFYKMRGVSFGTPVSKIKA